MLSWVGGRMRRQSGGFTHLTVQEWGRAQASPVHSEARGHQQTLARRQRQGHYLLPGSQTCPTSEQRLPCHYSCPLLSHQELLRDKLCPHIQIHAEIPAPGTSERDCIWGSALQRCVKLKRRPDSRPHKKGKLRHQDASGVAYHEEVAPCVPGKKPQERLPC